MICRNLFWVAAAHTRMLAALFATRFGRTLSSFRTELLVNHELKESPTPSPRQTR